MAPSLSTELTESSSQLPPERPSQGVSVVIQIASTVILSRLLSPDDYGVMAMVMAVTGFAGLFRDLGLSAASIQKGDLSHSQMSNLFWLNVGMGTLLTAALAAASPLVAWFYGEPELVSLTLLLSSTFLISSLGTQHGALMQREMLFGRRAVTGIIGSLVGLAISVILALRGERYWALAWGSIVASLVTTALLFALSSFRPGLWTKGAGIRSMMKFGANVTAFDFVNYFHRNLDNILIGKFWGPIQLGLYSRAYALLMFPINAIRGPINAVAFPAMSRLQNQPEAYRAYYRRVTQLLAFISMPLTAFLFVASEPIIELLLGKNWGEVSPIFSILAMIAFIQPVWSLWGMVLLSRGMGRRYLQLGALNAICTTVGFAAGLSWGAVGVAKGYAIMTYASAFPILWLAFRGTPVRVTDFLTSVRIPCIASVFGAFACLLIISHIHQLSQFLQLAILASVFSCVYLAIFVILPEGRKEVSSISNVLIALR